MRYQRIESGASLKRERCVSSGARASELVVAMDMERRVFVADLIRYLLENRVLGIWHANRQSYTNLFQSLVTSTQSHSCDPQQLIQI